MILLEKSKNKLDVASCTKIGKWSEENNDLLFLETMGVYPFTVSNGGLGRYSHSNLMPNQQVFFFGIGTFTIFLGEGAASGVGCLAFLEAAVSARVLTSSFRKAKCLMLFSWNVDFSPLIFVFQQNAFLH